MESLEDVVLSKLRWYRFRGQTSDRQWNDVLGVLKMNVFDLDFAYLDHWANELRITDLLERAFDEAGILEADAENGAD